MADLLVALDRAGLELPIFRLPIGQRHGGVGGDGREPAEVGPSAIARFAAEEIHSIHIAVGFPKLEAHLLGGRAGEIGQLRRVVLGLKGVTVASSRSVVPMVPALYAGLLFTLCTHSSRRGLYPRIDCGRGRRRPIPAWRARRARAIHCRHR